MPESGWWLTVENERRLLFWMSSGVLVSALALCAKHLTMPGHPAQYGRYSLHAQGRLLDSRFAWFLQEAPALLVPVLLWLFSATPAVLTNKLLLAAFIVHYGHRYSFHSAIFSPAVTLCTALITIIHYVRFTISLCSADAQKSSSYYYYYYYYYYYFIRIHGTYTHTFIHTGNKQTYNRDYEINLICTGAGLLVQYQLFCSKTVMKKNIVSQHNTLL